MPTFIKTGYWEKLSKGFKGYLNLDELIKGNIPAADLNTNQLNAIKNAGLPSAQNVFATMNQLPVAVSKLYTAFVSQAGTNAPTEDSLLRDDLATPVWAYSTVGVFTLTKAGAFTLNKTVPSKVEPFTDAAGNLLTLERTSSDMMTLKTYAAADTTVLANGVLSAQYINIEIYL